MDCAIFHEMTRRSLANIRPHNRKPAFRLRGRNATLFRMVEYFQRFTKVNLFLCEPNNLAPERENPWNFKPERKDGDRSPVAYLLTDKAAVAVIPKMVSNRPTVIFK